MKKIFAAVLIGLGCYFWPEISDVGWTAYNSVRGFSFPSSRMTVITVPTPVKPVVKVAPKGQYIIVQEVSPEPVYVPRATEPEPQPEIGATTTKASAPIVTKSDPYESKLKRGVKALGRFFKPKEDF
jgi:hypothetical protein